MAPTPSAERAAQARRRARCARAGALLGSCLAGSLAACSAKTLPSSSFVRIELVPVAGPTQPRNVEVVISPADGAALPVCVSIVGDAGKTAASLVLERAPDRDALIPVRVTVTPFGPVAGELGPGQEFTCPAVLPPALGPAQELDVAFCAGQARRVVFHVTAGCGCSGMGGSGGGGSGGTGAGGRGGDGTGGAATGGGAPTGGAGATAGAGGAGNAGGAGGAATGGGGAGGAAATCCPADEVCGAGVSTTGASCAPGQCCRQRVLDSCAALELPL
ncbi:MAG: hypothetical protein HY908_07290 [Myxococcales bacterium]|nr:hypothetical protein [Myxococcales bacterium]